MISLVGCGGLNPAPITTLDVRRELKTLPPAQRPMRATQLSCEIAVRKGQLMEYERSLTPPWWVWVTAPLSVGLPMQLAGEQAREETRAEIMSLDRKRGMIDAIMEDMSTAE